MLPLRSGTMIEFVLAQDYLVAFCSGGNANQDGHLSSYDRLRYWGIDVHMSGIGDHSCCIVYQLNMDGALNTLALVYHKGNLLL
jgi:hypothetical protein